jgi:hypothetical protein
MKVQTNIDDESPPQPENTLSIFRMIRSAHCTAAATMDSVLGLGCRIDPMPTYLPDTNVLVDLGRDPAVQTKLENVEQSGSTFVIAPSTMTELTVGVVKGGATYFEQNKKIFAWLYPHSDVILDLPRPFIGKTLGFQSQRGQVETHHHVRRIEMVANSQTFDEFLKRKDDAGNVWSDIDNAAQIHNAQVDKEFAALEKFAKLPQGTFDVAAAFCKTFGAGGVCPDPKLFRQHFSAAVEYGEASIAKIKAGAQPWKNDRARYGDFQLFFYLADANITLLTSEDFSGDIKQSPQRTRIVGLDAL